MIEILRVSHRVPAKTGGLIMEQIFKKRKTWKIMENEANRKRKLFHFETDQSEEKKPHNV